MHISGNILLFVHLDKGHVSLCLHLTSSIFPFVLIRHVLICSTAKLLNHTWEEEIQICINEVDLPQGGFSYVFKFLQMKATIVYRYSVQTLGVSFFLEIPKMYYCIWCQCSLLIGQFENITPDMTLYRVLLYVEVRFTKVPTNI